MSSKTSSLVYNKQVQSALVQNLLLERRLWIERQLDPRRNIDKECGHPEVLTTMDYVHLYERGDIAKRVVSVWPEESWAEMPSVYENNSAGRTDFEEAWMDLNKRMRLLAEMQRIDLLSGIGRYGVFLLGTNDGLPLFEPLPGINERGEMDESTAQEGLELIYVRAFNESHAVVISLQTDTTNPRFGLPQLYQIGFQDLAISSNITTNKQVHWSRVVHIADNRMDSNVYGEPRMKPVMNRLLDIAKISGGSGEMFWKGGFPGVSLETIPQVVGSNVIEIDTDSTKKQMEAYMNGLQRYIATVGLTAKSLSVQVADPTPHLNVQTQLIALTLGIPWRVFSGSEVGQLASSQDAVAWLRRVDRRRRSYVTPFLILPILERLVTVGILPLPKEIKVSWPELYSPSLTEKADVAQKRSQALAQYVSSGANELMPPFHFFVTVLGMSDEEAYSILNASTDELDKIDGDSFIDGGLPKVIKTASGKSRQLQVPTEMDEEEEEARMLGEYGNTNQGGGVEQVPIPP